MPTNIDRPPVTPVTTFHYPGVPLVLVVLLLACRANLSAIVLTTAEAPERRRTWADSTTVNDYSTTPLNDLGHAFRPIESGHSTTLRIKTPKGPLAFRFGQHALTILVLLMLKVIHVHPCYPRLKTLRLSAFSCLILPLLCAFLCLQQPAGR